MADNTMPVALVTGGAAGIGQATVARLMEDGYAVAIVDRTPVSVAAGATAKAFALDLSSAAGISETVDQVVQHFGRLDVLVNNAGQTLPKALNETAVEDWDSVQSVNLRAQFVMIKACLTALKQAPAAAIVNVASFHAVATIENFAAYAASKSGVVGLTRSSALELAPAGIRVNAICPGIVHTSMVDAWLDTQSDQDAALASMVEKQPLGRLGRPQEVAAAISFLAGRDASYITGTTLVVDGGVSARLWHA